MSDPIEPADAPPIEPVETAPVVEPVVPPPATPPAPLPVEPPAPDFPKFEVPAYVPPQIDFGDDDYAKDIATKTRKEALGVFTGIQTNQFQVEQIARELNLTDETKYMAQQILAMSGEEAARQGAGFVAVQGAIGAIQMQGKSHVKARPAVSAPAVAPVGNPSQVEQSSEDSHVESVLGAGWTLDDNGRLVKA